MPKVTDLPVLRLVREGDAYPPFDKTLVCCLKRLEYDAETQIGTLWLADGHCTDMNGAISVFEGIDPDVLVIVTMSGEEPDTSYIRADDGKWRAVRAPGAT
jgi:hypothetical protein